jgi:hypothetical protein
MSIDLHPIHELRVQIVAIERSAANSNVSPDCQSYVDLLKRSRQAIDALLLARQEVLGRVHAWERAGVVGSAVSPPEVMEIDRCS